MSHGMWPLLTLPLPKLGHWTSSTLSNSWPITVRRRVQVRRPDGVRGGDGHISLTYGKPQVEYTPQM